MPGRDELAFFVARRVAVNAQDGLMNEVATALDRVRGQRGVRLWTMLVGTRECAENKNARSDGCGGEEEAG